ncbi:MAG TPA: YlmC/YmxH family sporulation protein [Ruminococcus sp.]|nr:YlmC/YmxH family sporulation protein [Ruminococcus sp.]
MKCGLGDLRRKEVIDIQTGERLGYIDDAVIDLDSSKIESLTIYGRQRLFGIFGREEDIFIPCSDICVIGSEVILVKLSVQHDSSYLINNSKKWQKSL